MCELKKNWKSTDEYICWERALVLWKKNLPGRGLTKVENTDLECAHKRTSNWNYIQDVVENQLHTMTEKLYEVLEKKFKLWIWWMHGRWNLSVQAFCLFRTVHVTVSTNKHYLLLTFKF